MYIFPEILDLAVPKLCSSQKKREFPPAFGAPPPACPRTPAWWPCHQNRSPHDWEPPTVCIKRQHKAKTNPFSKEKTYLGKFLRGTKERTTTANDKKKSWKTRENYPDSGRPSIHHEMGLDLVVKGIHTSIHGETWSQSCIHNRYYLWT